MFLKDIPMDTFMPTRQRHDREGLSLFKRMFYYALVKFIQESEYTFCALIGPRQVGKSYALLQLTQEFSQEYRICYYDVKQLRGFHFVQTGNIWFYVQQLQEWWYTLTSIIAKNI